MSQWFRMYAEVLDDPKAQRLAPPLFKAWVNLLCLTAKHDGTLPPIEDIAFALRTDEKSAHTTVGKLMDAGLIDATETALQPHNWNGRQFKSDASNERVKRHREHRATVARNADVTLHETPPETETETETDSVPNGTGAFAPCALPIAMQATKVTSPESIRDLIWSAGLAYVSDQSGKPPDKLRSWLGRLCKSHGDADVLAALANAQRDTPVDPVAWIERKLNGKRTDSGLSAFAAAASEIAAGR